jgi:hypothetical protein
VSSRRESQAAAAAGVAWFALGGGRDGFFLGSAAGGICGCGGAREAGCLGVGLVLVRCGNEAGGAECGLVGSVICGVDVQRVGGRRVCLHALRGAGGSCVGCAGVHSAWRKIGGAECTLRVGGL